MQSFNDLLRHYDYDLPPDLIAQAPAEPRDSSKLLVYDRETDQRTWTVFSQIGSFFQPHALLVINVTKVIPAKLPLQRSDGSSVDALILGTHSDHIRALLKGKFPEGERLILPDGCSLTFQKRIEKEALLRPSFPPDQLSTVLEQFGSAPLPPYIDHSPLTPEQIRERYQSVFAQDQGSIAAPTASLHFTDPLIDSLKAKGIDFAEVTLHVHLGTFAPLTEEQWASGTLHHEMFSIDPAQAEIISRAKKEGQPIIPVGTTALRTLESAFDEHGDIIRLSGSTDLFIREGYRFKMPSGLITNFHVPKSSLLMLVAAMVGREKILELYKEAIEHRFRFFSFGDAMLIN